MVLEIDGILEHAKGVMERTGKEHSPMFLLEGREGVVIVAANIDDDAKDELVKTLKELVKENEVNRYHFICSTWVSKRVKDKPLKGRPRDDPERVNALLVQTYARGEMSKTLMLTYEMNEDKTFSFGDTEHIDGGSGWSRFNVFAPLEVDLDDDGNVK